VPLVVAVAPYTGLLSTKNYLEDENTNADGAFWECDEGDCRDERVPKRRRPIQVFDSSQPTGSTHAENAAGMRTRSRSGNGGLIGSG
jgi:hypothetical protein